MKSATHHCDLPRRVIASPSLETTKFKDGMVITANDLDTAMRYPLAVFQTLIRAYFGCGVVCGLELEIKKAPPSKDYNDKNKPPVAVRIGRGTALGCDGFPIELCAPVTLPLTLDPCCDDPPQCVCIAIRRITSDEAPRDDCGCSKDTDAPRYQCTRVKDHVEIKAFACDDLPEGICARPEPKTSIPAGATGPAGAVVEDRHEIDCKCLTTCSDCDCCGPSWVLLGCVDLKTSKVDPGRRKYVKPIECLCRPKPKDPKAGVPPSPQAPEPYAADRKRPPRK